MEPNENLTEQQGSNTNEFSDYSYEESESFGTRLKAFFTDRRKVLITAAVLLLIGGTIAAVFAFKNNKGPGSVGQAEVGKLPLAGDGSAFDVFAGYPEDGKIVLSWSTDKLCDGRVYYGRDTNYGFWADDQDTLTQATYSKEHRVLVDGLNPNEIYNFKATSLCEDKTVLSSSNFALKPEGDITPPAVSLTNRKEGDTLSGSAEICAQASDERSVQRMILFIDGRPAQSVSDKATHCFSLSTENLTNSSHTITVSASDGTNDTLTTPITVTVNNPDNNPDDNDDDESDNDDFEDKYGCVELDPNLKVEVRPISSGDVLTGKVDLTIAVISNGGHQIDRAILSVDDWFKAEDFGVPYSFTLDTRTYVDGDHAIYGIAMTANGICNDYLNNGKVDVKFSNPTDANSAPKIYMVSAASQTNTITVTWETDKPTDSVVKYSKGSAIQTTSKSELTTAHAVELTGLTPNTWYQLTLEGTAQNGLTGSYSTNTATKNIYDTIPPVPPCTAGNCPPPTIPPECSNFVLGLVTTLTSPANNSNVSGNFTLTASANQPIAKMFFYIGNTQIGSVLSSPYTLTVSSSPYPNGNYIIRALAVNSAGGCSSFDYTGSHTARITINNSSDITPPCTASSCPEPIGPPPPSDCTSVDPTLLTILSSPQNGDVISGDMTLTASANRPIQRMAFLLGDQEIGSDAVSPYSMVVNSGIYPNGSYIIRAVAVAATGCSSVAYTGAHTASITIANNTITTNPPSTLPSIVLYAVPSTINIGQSTSLIWTVSNADSCTASNGWSGNKSLSGSQIVSPTATATYVLTCTNEAGTATQNTIVTVDATPSGEPLPTVMISANPPTISRGQNSALLWTTQNATACTASNGWSGTKPTIGSQLISPTENTTYNLSCSGPGGNTTQSIIVTVGPPTESDTLPIVTLIASPSTINSGQSSTLIWAAANATACTASNGWSGSKGFSGTQSVSPTGTTTYVLTCTNEIGTASQNTIITVDTTPVGNPLPTINLTATPSTIVQGESFILSWTTQNATACTASNGWSGNKQTSASETLSPAVTTTYALSCTGAGGSATQSIVVTLDSDEEPPCQTGSCTQPPVGPPPPDDCTAVNTNIHVTLTAPANNSTISGTFTASATVDVTIQTMHFFIGDAEIAGDNSPPYSASVNSASYPNGNYVIRAIATNANGQCSSIDYEGPHTAQITISNGDDNDDDDDDSDDSDDDDNDDDDDTPPSSDTGAPTSPTALQVTSVGETTVNISWTASTDNVAVTGYKIFRNGSEVRTQATTTYQDTGLSKGSVYSYFVRAIDAAGNTSSSSNVVEAFTDTSFEVSDVQAVADDILVNFKFNTSLAASSVISFGESAGNLNRTVNVASGVSIWDGGRVNKVASSFWKKITRGLLSKFVSKASAAFPSVTLSASTYKIDRGQSVKLSWSTNSANICSATWTSSPTVALSGEVTVSPTSTTRYSISCLGSRLINSNFATNLNSWANHSGSGSSISWSNSNGGSMLLNGAAAYANADQEIPTTAGTVYEGKIRVHAIQSGTSLQVQAGTTEGASNLLNASFTAAGLHSFSFTATGSKTFIRIRSGWDGAIVDDVTIYASEDTDRDGVTIVVNHPYSGYATGLQANKIYYYKVVSTATKDSNLRSESSVSTFQTGIAPTVNNLTASVSWSSTTNGIGRVFYSRLPLTDPNANPGVVVAGVSGPSPYNYTAVLVGLAAQKTYYYKYQTLTQCATEFNQYGSTPQPGNYCNFSGTKTVLYGANGSYVSTNATSPVLCANNYVAGTPTAFADPAPTVLKYCYVESQEVSADVNNKPLQFTTPVSN